MPGFKIDLAFLSRETIVNIRKRATKTTFKNRQPQEELDDELFLKLYALINKANDATIAGDNILISKNLFFFERFK